MTSGHPNEVYAIAYYLHESEERGVRYRSNPPLTYDKDANTLSAAHIGIPVAVEWYARPQGIGEYRVVSTCGVVPPLVFEHIFSSGFEIGSTNEWSAMVPPLVIEHIFSSGFETGNTDEWSAVVP